GRIGDLLIGDHLGKQTSGFWGWKYKGGELISPPRCNYPTFDGCIHQGMVVHQTSLYDQIWSLVIFGVLMVLDRKPRNRGFLFLVWAAMYAVGRIGTDFARVDKHWLGLGLTGSQLTSIVVVLVAAFLLLRYKGIPPRWSTVPAMAPAMQTSDASAAPDPLTLQGEPQLPYLDAPAPDGALAPPQDDWAAPGAPTSGDDTEIKIIASGEGVPSATGGVWVTPRSKDDPDGEPESPEHEPESDPES
ncbi:MAG: prolipoprotein diacylglyceryl transferase, partial [Actinobacteria bacterium]|nr:prolipoprotein diacylglyceryl transferase [Actinomycetota bacterium]